MGGGDGAYRYGDTIAKVPQSAVYHPCGFIAEGYRQRHRTRERCRHKVCHHRLVSRDVVCPCQGVRPTRSSGGQTHGVDARSGVGVGGRDGAYHYGDTIAKVPQAAVHRPRGLVSEGHGQRHRAREGCRYKVRRQRLVDRDVVGPRQGVRAAWPAGGQADGVDARSGVGVGGSDGAHRYGDTIAKVPQVAIYRLSGHRQAGEGHRQGHRAREGFRYKVRRRRLVDRNVVRPRQGIRPARSSGREADGIDARGCVDMGGVGDDTRRTVAKGPLVAGHLAGGRVGEGHRQRHCARKRCGGEVGHGLSLAAGDLPHLQQGQVTAIAGPGPDALDNLHVAVGHQQRTAVALRHKGGVGSHPIGRRHHLAVKFYRPKVLRRSRLVVADQGEDLAVAAVLHLDGGRMIVVQRVAPGGHKAIVAVGQINAEDDVATIPHPHELVVQFVVAAVHPPVVGCLINVRGVNVAVTLNGAVGKVLAVLLHLDVAHARLVVGRPRPGVGPKGEGPRQRHRLVDGDVLRSRQGVRPGRAFHGQAHVEGSDAGIGIRGGGHTGHHRIRTVAKVPGVGDDLANGLGHKGDFMGNRTSRLCRAKEGLNALICPSVVVPLNLCGLQGAAVDGHQVQLAQPGPVLTQFVGQGKRVGLIPVGEIPTNGGADHLDVVQVDPGLPRRVPGVNHMGQIGGQRPGRRGDGWVGPIVPRRGRAQAHLVAICQLPQGKVAVACIGR